MLLYRIADPGQGFSIESLTHSAINNPDDDPLRHAFVREEKGLRPGGLGPRDHALAGRRADLQRKAQRGRVRESTSIRCHEEGTQNTLNSRVTFGRRARRDRKECVASAA